MLVRHSTEAINRKRGLGRLARGGLSCLTLYSSKIQAHANKKNEIAQKIDFQRRRLVAFVVGRRNSIVMRVVREGALGVIPTLHSLAFGSSSCVVGFKIYNS